MGTDNEHPVPYAGRFTPSTFTALPMRLFHWSYILQTLPLELGISLELAHPGAALRDQFSLGRSHSLNTFVDAVLSAVYSTLAALQQRRSTGKELQRRKLVFSSFAPDICAALNWKQPNCTNPTSNLPKSAHPLVPGSSRCRILCVGLWRLGLAVRGRCYMLYSGR